VIKVSVEVRSATAHFRVAVWAQSIEKAVSLVNGRYAGDEAKVVFPIEPEAFFVKGALPTAGTVVPEVPETVAG
jgi:hypothetical protein